MRYFSRKSSLELFNATPGACLPRPSGSPALTAFVGLKMSHLDQNSLDQPRVDERPQKLQNHHRCDLEASSGSVAWSNQSLVSLERTLSRMTGPQPALVPLHKLTEGALPSQPRQWGGRWSAEFLFGHGATRAW